MNDERLCVVYIANVDNIDQALSVTIPKDTDLIKFINDNNCKSLYICDDINEACNFSIFLNSNMRGI